MNNGIQKIHSPDDLDSSSELSSFKSESLEDLADLSIELSNYFSFYFISGNIYYSFSYMLSSVYTIVFFFANRVYFDASSSSISKSISLTDTLGRFASFFAFFFFFIFPSCYVDWDSDSTVSISEASIIGVAKYSLRSTQSIAFALT